MQKKGLGKKNEIEQKKSERRKQKMITNLVTSKKA